MRKAASLLIFVCITSAFVIAGDIQTRVVTSSTSFTTDVPEHVFLRIYNFTQDGGSTRGVVIAAAATPAPTATPTPTSTATPTPTPPTPTPSPTPTPTPTPTPSPTPTPTPPPRTVLTASLVDSASAPEFIKHIVIDGPAQITVTCPDPSATCVISYQKVFEPTPTPTPSSVVVTATATPTATPTPTP
jgi:hypothetical protein